jgi:hypothetical protein
MPQLSNIPKESRFMGLFVGKSGSGKKSAIASFPKPIHILDFDGRIRGINGSSFVSPEGISYEYYAPRGDKPTINRLNDDLGMMELQMKQGTLPFKTLAVCSLTGTTRNFLLDAIKLTHSNDDPKKTRGMYQGVLAIEGPEDYKYEATGTMQFMSFLRSMPVNIVVCAHLVDQWGKPTKSDGSVDPYAESVVIGKKLSLREKIAENNMIYFDHVFSFRKELVGVNRVDHKVRFRGDLERTAYPELPAGEVDITNKPFYPLMMSYVNKDTLEVKK